ncbi:putative splicing factor, arginine/serine-rich 7, partial [Ophiophagus hannah]
MPKEADWHLSGNWEGLDMQLPRALQPVFVRLLFNHEEQPMTIAVPVSDQHPLQCENSFNPPWDSAASLSNSEGWLGQDFLSERVSARSVAEEDPHMLTPRLLWIGDTQKEWGQLPIYGDREKKKGRKEGRKERGRKRKKERRKEGGKEGRRERRKEKGRKEGKREGEEGRKEAYSNFTRETSASSLLNLKKLARFNTNQASHCVGMQLPALSPAVDFLHYKRDKSLRLDTLI